VVEGARDKHRLARKLVVMSPLLDFPRFDVQLDDGIEKDGLTLPSCSVRVDVPIWLAVVLAIIYPWQFGRVIDERPGSDRPVAALMVNRRNPLAGYTLWFGLSSRDVR
jgi:hypothetical protein